MNISYNKIDRTVRVLVNHRPYAFRLSLNGLQELESVAFGGFSYFDYQKKHEIMPMEVLLEAFRIMLRSAGEHEAAKNPLKIAEAICQEDGLQGLEEIFYVTLAVSGIFGVKSSADMLRQFGLENKDPEPEKEDSERKN